ncbi:interferon-induced protein with tetratricopeptide repeats 2-like [Betta splendens]|uniref:Interferon-induced protein with tetratricopeptide repeats 2-like n=1 Tax=Betta splendens TaxID=158456 RepID=A0A6P7MD42_BETSP|nr:interferon-induced protein with tetratricopeptide repeats 2-like [Betta splendens]
MELQPKHSCTLRPRSKASSRNYRRKSVRMSVAQNQPALESDLEALECHFTWDLVPSRSQLFRLRDQLEDIGTEEGYSWLGHIYNLQGYVHCQLGLLTEAQRFLGRAAEAFRQIRNTVSDDGPWLMVNYGNQAWLHHHLGAEAESQASLTKLHALKSKYPPPTQDELHPEVCAEKAWTLMKFSTEQKLLAADYFQRAIRMQPDMVEWQSSHVLALVKAFEHQPLRTDVLEKMKIAKKHDPENLYLAALYLKACAESGRKTEDEARDLARRVLTKPVSSYSGIKPLLKLFSVHVSIDEAIDLSEEAVERHPDNRYLKRCAAMCYKTRIMFQKDHPLEHSLVERAISLYREVISLYPHSSHKRRISLANIYAQTNYSQVSAEQMYEKLLEGDLEPAEAQMLYNHYAKHLHSTRKDKHRSIEYHMKAAAIAQPSSYRHNSISILQRVGARNRNRMCGEIQEFLTHLH